MMKSLPVRLIIALVVGIILGTFANEAIMNVVVSVRHLSGQIIFFIVPLIVLGFVVPSVARMGTNASKLLIFSIVLAYTLSLAVAFFATGLGFLIIPHLSIQNNVEELRTLPALLFELNIPPVMSAISAMVLSIFTGLAVVWTKASKISALLEEMHKIVLAIVTKIMLPVLPVFISMTFASLAYDGRLTRQLPVFLQVILIIIAAHYVKLVVLYLGAAIYSRKNPLEVLRHYGPAYMTAFGTMSSAATLPVALKSASKSDILPKNIIDFGIPFFANIYLGGSVLSISFLVMVISYMFNGALPDFSTMSLFVVLLGVFAVAAPGIPGGTVMASLGLMGAVLGMDDVATGLLITVFALQDSFTTSTNITSDGALLMILSKFAQVHGLVKVNDEEAESFEQTIAS